MAQLLCCIPLTSVEPVLTWLTSAMPQCEQKDLLLQVTTLFMNYEYVSDILPAAHIAPSSGTAA